MFPLSPPLGGTKDGHAPKAKRGVSVLRWDGTWCSVVTLNSHLAPINNFFMNSNENHFYNFQSMFEKRICIQIKE